MELEWRKALPTPSDVITCDNLLIPKRYILGYELFYINNITLVNGYSLTSFCVWCLDFTMTFFH